MSVSRQEFTAFAQLQWEHGRPLAAAAASEKLVSPTRLPTNSWRRVRNAGCRRVPARPSRELARAQGRRESKTLTTHDGDRMSATDSSSIRSPDLTASRLVRACASGSPRGGICSPRPIASGNSNPSKIRKEWPRFAAPTDIVFKESLGAQQRGLEAKCCPPSPRPQPSPRGTTSAHALDPVPRQPLVIGNWQYLLMAHNAAC